MRKEIGRTINIMILVIVLLIGAIPFSGWIGSRIARNRQIKPIDLDFNSIGAIDEIFDGFKGHVYNSTSETVIYYEYSIFYYDYDLDEYYYNSNYSDIGYEMGYEPPDEPDNSYMQALRIYTNYQNDCAFQDITFILNGYSDIDYSKLNIVVWGDGDLIYCNSNIESDFTIEFNPKVIEIIILVF